MGELSAENTCYFLWETEDDAKNAAVGPEEVGAECERVIPSFKSKSDVGCCLFNISEDSLFSVHFVPILLFPYWLVGTENSFMIS